MGDVIEPEYDVIAIGSGGNYALAAARAYSENEELSAREIASKALNIASDICVYTNKSISRRRTQGECMNFDELTPSEIVGELDKFIIGTR